jgi:hypothetical protein
MDNLWQWLQQNGRPLTILCLPIVFWVLNASVKHLVGLFNWALLGAELAFCGFSISASTTVRLILGLVKNGSATVVLNNLQQTTSIPAQNQLLLSFGLTLICLAIWVIVLRLGVAFNETLRRLTEIKEALESVPSGIVSAGDPPGGRNVGIVGRLTAKCCWLVIFSSFLGGLILYLATSYAWFSFS